MTTAVAVLLCYQWSGSNIFRTNGNAAGQTAAGCGTELTHHTLQCFCKLHVRILSETQNYAALFSHTEIFRQKLQQKFHVRLMLCVKMNHNKGKWHRLPCDVYTISECCGRWRECWTPLHQTGHTTEDCLAAGSTAIRRHRYIIYSRFCTMNPQWSQN